MGCFRICTSITAVAEVVRLRSELSRVRLLKTARHILFSAMWVACAAPLGAADPLRLTTDGVLKASPVFFNGEREIIYADLEKPEQWRLRRLNLATRLVEWLHPKASTSEFEPAVSARTRSTSEC